MAGSEARETVTIGVATPARMTVHYAYLTPATALGYDWDEGLDLRIFHGGEPGATAQAIAAGKCDIASLNTIVGFVGRFEEGIPMLAVGSAARRSHRYFAVLEDSPIRDLADLAGKRIACDFPHLQVLAHAALAEVGVPPESFEWVGWHGSDMDCAGMTEPLRRGEADAMFVMDWILPDARNRGLALRTLRSALFERISASSCYWTTDAIFAARRDALGRALRAIAKSVAFSFANPEAAVRAMWEVYPDTKPVSGDPEAVLRAETEVLKTCLARMRIGETDPDPRWCAISDDAMRTWQETLTRTGTIRAGADHRLLYTTELVDGINDFDAEAVRAAAREHRMA
ncbi:MAG: ABC transporter substrate-binding protein [Rhodospirillaceae bacterium]|jgi:NitT/TauT family transport system substrate-binding protein|nr:ABC transporter substrate-binding protein [Rhodospirillaceae bacterium]MBT6117093.1 ABC transporter substrate-binding protein [Rhodospirillaceae bacterium]